MTAETSNARGDLPSRDESRAATEQGLFRKFDVRRTDGSDAHGGKHHGCEYFVLDMTHDPHAKAAAAAYADSAQATHPQLATDMRVRYGLAAPPPAAAQHGKAVPEGWVLVPRVPTQAMQEAFNDWRPTEGNNYAGAQSFSAQERWAFRQRYAAMLAAAPPPAAAEPKTLPVPTRVYLTDKAAVIVGDPQRGWDEEGPDAHNCDDMGCSTIGPHVLARVQFTDERALSQQPEARVYQCPRCATSMEVDPTAKPEARGVVDEAMVDRAGQALYGTDWGSLEGWEADQLRRKVRAVLTAALTEARNVR